CGNHRPYEPLLLRRPHCKCTLKKCTKCYTKIHRTGTSVSTCKQTRRPQALIGPASVALDDSSSISTAKHLDLGRRLCFQKVLYFRSSATLIQGSPLIISEFQIKLSLI